MIVDTSALIAVIADEPGAKRIKIALVRHGALLPAPMLTEFHRVVSRKAGLDGEVATALVRRLIAAGAVELAFTPEHADVARQANTRFGIGAATNGSLNLLDLMVYACAKVEERPILCTGRDFAATDAAIHPASRTD